MSEKNKDLKTIDDALNSGALNENDVFEFDSATVEIIFGAAERMAREIERLENEMNTLMNKNLPEEMREMHRRQKEYIQHQRQHLKNMTRKYKNSLESKQKALWGMSKAIDSRDFDISRLKAEFEKRPEVIYCGTCKYYVPNENFCNAGLLGKVSPFDFCFRGQRRESEEGK